MLLISVPEDISSSGTDSDINLDSMKKLEYFPPIIRIDSFQTGLIMGSSGGGGSFDGEGGGGSGDPSLPEGVPARKLYI